MEEDEEKRRVRFAVICASNQNRSMEAHRVLKEKKLNVKSYGTGTQVRLPGPSIDKQNVYPFNTPYDDIYADLQEKDYNLYTENGLLTMLDRNRKIKRAPQRWHEERVETFDVVITCEERCFDSVCEDILLRNMTKSQVVHVLNVEIRDNPEDAAIGAQYISILATEFENCSNVHAEIEDIIARFLEKNPQVPLTYSCLFY